MPRGSTMSGHNNLPESNATRYPEPRRAPLATDSAFPCS